MKKDWTLILGIIILLSIIFYSAFVLAKSFNPEDNREIGYEFLDDGKVIHIWNSEDDYFFNKTSGIQFTNHYQEHWTKNIFCVGMYPTEDTWVEMACVDSFDSLNYTVETDNSTYVKLSFWKDFEKPPTTLRLGVNYYLESNDRKLIINVSTKNVGTYNFPLDLGFTWKVRDIKISNNENDRIRINGSEYDLDESVNLIFSNMSRPILEPIYNNETNITTYNILGYEYLPSYTLSSIQENGFIKLDWNKNLNYKVELYSDGTQSNAYVMLMINAGILQSGQEKSTIFYWKDPETLYEWQYDEDDQIYTGNERALAQTFTVGTLGTNESFEIYKVHMKLQKSGEPETLTVNIWEVNASGGPDKTQGNLSTGTINASKLNGTNVWTNITMSPHILEPGEQYAIVLRKFGGGGNASSVYTSEQFGSDEYAGGAEWICDGDGGPSDDWGGTFYARSNSDLVFEIWGRVPDAIPPNMTINSPLNQSYGTTTIIFNVTAIDNYLDSCWVTIDDGITNLTLTNTTANDDYNATNTTIPIGGYIAKFFCNDSYNNVNNTETIEFGVDTIAPNLTITAPLGTISSKTTNVTITVNDIETGVDYCYFNITRGVATEITNTEISLVSLTQNFTVSTDADYVSHVSCNDSANNTNYSTGSFTVDTSVPVVGGGGGGGPSTVTKIAIKQPVNITKQDSLKRAILFSRIFEACGDDPDQIGKCRLTLERKKELISNLSKQTVEVDLEELNLWLQNFNNMFLEEVQVTISLADKYNLFVGVLREGMIFKVTPSRLDKYFFILSREPKTRIQITSNRILEEVLVVNGELDFKVELISDTVAEITLEPVNIDFSSKIFTGTINYIDEKGDSVFQEVNFRAINFLHKTTLIIMGIGIATIISLIFFRKKVKKIVGKIIREMKKTYRKLFKG